MHLDNLEPRALLAAGAFVDDGILYVRGANRAASTITLSAAPDGRAVEVLIQTLTPKGTKKTALSESFDLIEGYDSINVRGGLRGDRISIDLFGSTSGKLVLDAIVEGLAGDDTITGGDGDDRLLGGRGDDRLDGAQGDDILIGRHGGDTLLGGRGDDLLNGGDDRDHLEGQLGNDRLEESGAGNLLLGGSGRDRFVIKTLSGNQSDYTPSQDVISSIRPSRRPRDDDFWFISFGGGGFIGGGLSWGISF